MAASAFFDCRYDACLDAIHERKDAEAAILRARVLQRLEQDDAATWELSALPLGELPLGLAGRVRLELAHALIRLAKFDEARSQLDVARSAAYATGGAFGAYYQYAEGLFYAASAETERAELEARRGLEVLDTPTPSAFLFPYAQVRAFLFDVLGLVRRTQRAYHEQFSYLNLALVELDKANPRDPHMFASLMANLACYVRDLEPGNYAALEQRIAAISNSPYIAPRRFDCLRSLAWIKANDADHLGAFRYLRRAASVPVAPVRQLLALTDRALLAFGLGFRLQTHDELSAAEDLAERIDWDHPNIGDERVGLVYLAQALAPVYPRRARSALERYQRITERIRSSALHTDGRMVADEEFAHGLLAKQEGRRNAAIAKFASAFTFWSDVGFKWRAGLAAAELATLTRESRYAAYAVAEATRRPGSWVEKRIRSVLAASADAQGGGV